MTGASLAFFARHELRLAWREWLWWLKSKRRGVIAGAVVALSLFAGVLVVAGIVVAPFASLPDDSDRGGLLALTAAGVMAWLLLLSQAMESATRVLYARGDVDLILSSPAPARLVFGFRLTVLAGAATLFSMAMMSPFVTMLAWKGGARWLASYGVLAAMGASAAAAAILGTLALFRLVGPGRARLAAQIASAVIGGAMVISLQVAAILGHQGLDRFALFKTEAVQRLTPDLDSPLWWPARAAFGEMLPLLTLLALSLGFLAIAIAVGSRAFAHHVIAAGGAAAARVSAQARPVRFHAGGASAALRAKELALLARDPWLLSQSLMQILYLLPAALLLWQGFGGEVDPAPVIVPVIVMAAGQLAGGLAWLAISGEDAPDLVATAPVAARRVLSAKIEAVLIAVGLPVVPLILGLALLTPAGAIMAALFSLVAIAGSTAIQFLFRGIAKRSNFRRRQTASRVSTIAEAFSSILWAATAGLAVASSLLAIGPGVMAVIVLLVAWALAPPRTMQ